jgi:hypothetical protein
MVDFCERPGNDNSILRGLQGFCSNQGLVNPQLVFTRILHGGSRRFESCHRHALRARIETGCNSSTCVGKHNGELIGCDHVIIPCILISARRRCSRACVVEMPGECEHPCVIQPLLRIGTRAKPLRGNRRLLRSVGEILIPDDPSFVISL